MAWTNDQKKLFAMACQAAGLDDDQRRMVLSLSPHASCPRKRRPSAAADGLNNADFEHVMARLEAVSPRGVIRLRNRDGRYYDAFKPGHFQAKAEDDLSRMRGLADRLAGLLYAGGYFTGPPRDREAYRAFIARMTAERPEGRTDDLGQLDYRDLYNLIEAMKAICRRHGINPRPATFLGPGHMTTPAPGEAETYRDVLGIDIAGARQ